MKLASRFGRVNQVRRDRPLIREELMHYVPSVFSENKHESRSDRYTGYRLSLFLRICSGKVLNLSLPARPAFGTRADGSTPNTCCACVVQGNSPASRFPKLSSSIHTMAHPAIRCCRDCFVVSVPTDWSAGSHSAKCGCLIKGCGGESY